MLRSTVAGSAVRLLLLSPAYFLECISCYTSCTEDGIVTLIDVEVLDSCPQSCQTTGAFSLQEGGGLVQHPKRV